MNKRLALFILLSIVFIDLIGVGLIVPILPIVFFESNVLSPSVSIATKNMLIGFLIAAYPLAQFFGAPLLGALSDRHGRKKILLLSLLGSALGYLLFGIALALNNLYLLFLSRIIDGLSGGNISVARSAIIDLSENKDKTRNFGLIGMAFGLGFIFGPFLGGKLTDPTLISWFSLQTPFYAAGLLTFLNMIFVIFLFQETLVQKIHRKITLLTGLTDIQKAFQRPSLRMVFISLFLFMFGWSFFTQFFQIYLYHHYSFTPSDIGVFFAYVGFWIALAQGFLVRLFDHLWKPRFVLLLFLPLISLILLLQLLMTQSFWIYVLHPFIAISIGFVMPNFSTLISNSVDQHEQGEAMGIQQSLMSFAQVIPPLLGGFSLNLSPSMPLILASVIVLLAWCSIAFSRSVSPKVTF